MKKEPKTKKNRRYYLHRKVKEFTKVYARKKTVEVTETLLESVSDLRKMYLNELKDLGYNLQYVIQ